MKTRRSAISAAESPPGKNTKGNREKGGEVASEGAWSGARARAQRPQSGVGSYLSRSENDRTA